MKRDDVIRMAKSCGAHSSALVDAVCFRPDELERFAALVEAHTKERCLTACAGVANRLNLPAAYGAMESIEAIRALGDE